MTIVVGLPGEGRLHTHGFSQEVDLLSCSCLPSFDGSNHRSHARSDQSCELYLFSSAIRLWACENEAVESVFFSEANTTSNLCGSVVNR